MIYILFCNKYINTDSNSRQEKGMSFSFIQCKSSGICNQLFPISADKGVKQFNILFYSPPLFPYRVAFTVRTFPHVKSEELLLEGHFGSMADAETSRNILSLANVYQHAVDSEKGRMG